VIPGHLNPQGLRESITGLSGVWKHGGIIIRKIRYSGYKTRDDAKCYVQKMLKKS
jgi:hypothetical protein